jgi:hypothetical protein
MNPLFLTPFRCWTLLLTLALANFAIAQESASPEPAKVTPQNQPSPLEEFTVRNEKLAVATHRALKDLSGKALQIFKEGETEFEEWRKAVFSDPDGRSLRAGELEEARLVDWTDEVKRRMSWIHGLMDYRHHTDLTGFWSDGIGGRLSIVDRGSQLHFLFSCVRGAARHQGSIKGIALRSGNIALLTLSEYEGEPTQLRFTLEKPWIVVTSKNTEPYHGNRAFFDGNYAKIAPLSAEDQAIVIEGTQPAP